MTRRVEFEPGHLRAAEKAALLLRLFDQADHQTFMGAGSVDRELTLEFLDELVLRMQAARDETESLRVDNVVRFHPTDPQETRGLT